MHLVFPGTCPGSLPPASFPTLLSICWAGKGAWGGWEEADYEG